MTEQSLGGIEGPSKTTQPVGRARAWLAVRLPAPETGFVSPQQRREQTRPLCGLYLHPSAMLRFSCTCAIRALVQGGNAMTHCTWNCGQSVRHTAACAVGGMPPRVPGARASGPSPSPLHSLPLVSLPPPGSVSPSFPPPSLSLSLFPPPSLPLSLLLFHSLNTRKNSPPDHSKGAGSLLADCSRLHNRQDKPGRWGALGHRGRRPALQPCSPGARDAQSPGVGARGAGRRNLSLCRENDLHGEMPTHTGVTTAPQRNGC